MELNDLSQLGITQEIYDGAVSLAIILAILLLGRTLVTRLLLRNEVADQMLYLWKKSTFYGILGIMIISAGMLWMTQIASLGAFLGVVSVGLAFLLKDPLTNLVGWLYVVSRRAFRVGDRIEIDGLIGDIVDFKFFNTVLMEIDGEKRSELSTGRLVHVPNSTFMARPVYNFNHGFSHIWNEVNVLITFESDWKMAEGFLRSHLDSEDKEISNRVKQQLRKLSPEFLLLDKNVDPQLFISVVSDGVELRMRYLVEPKNRVGSEDRIWRGILDDFNSTDKVNFAYRTIRGFNLGEVVDTNQK